MRWLTVALAVLALSVVGAGCGGGDESSASGDTYQTDTLMEETTSAEETTTEQETSGDADLSSVFASEDCLRLVAVAAGLGQAFAGAAGDTEASEAFDEIADDFQVLANAYADYAAALRDIGLEEGETPSVVELQELQGAIASLDQEAVSEASANISAYADANCSG